MLILSGYLAESRELQMTLINIVFDFLFVKLCLHIKNKFYFSSPRKDKFKSIGNCRKKALCVEIKY